MRLNCDKEKMRLSEDEITTVHPLRINPLKNWDTYILPKGALLFRGERANRKNTLLSGIGQHEIRPTWYTSNLRNAIGYLPSSAGKTKGGILYAYRTTKDLLLFEVNSVHNFNRLLNLFRNDDTCLWMRSDRVGSKNKAQAAKLRKGRVMYALIQHLFIGNWGLWHCDKSGDKSNLERMKLLNQGFPPNYKLKRGSLVNWDYIIADWLCANGFSGWHQGSDMKGILPEEMICKPRDSVALAATVAFPKGKGSGKNKKNMDAQVQKTATILDAEGYSRSTYDAS